MPSWPAVFVFIVIVRHSANLPPAPPRTQEKNPVALSQFTFRGVTYRYDESSGGLQFRFDQGIGNARLSVTYRVPWAQRKRAALMLLGYTTYRALPGLSFGYFHRVLPHSHPEAAPEGQFIDNESSDGPGRSWIWCTRADYVGHIRAQTLNDGEPGQKYAILSCVYEGRPYWHLTDSEIQGGGGTGDPALIPVDEGTLRRYVSHPCNEDKSRVKSEPGGKWRSLVAPFNVFTSPRFTTLIEEDLTFVWHQVLKFNWPKAVVAALKFGTNLESFNGYPAETLVFRKFSTRELPKMPDGQLAMDVSYHFSFHPFGANKLEVRPGVWEEHESVENPGTPPHAKVNYRSLFRPIAAPVDAVI